MLKKLIHNRQTPFWLIAASLLIGLTLPTLIQDGMFMDAMKAAGEDNSARLVAAAFCKQGVAAVYMDPRDAGMLLTDEFGNARLLDESYERLARALAGRQDNRRQSHVHLARIVRR